MKKVALIVGHNLRSKGAYSSIIGSEFDYWRRIAKEIKNIIQKQMSEQEKIKRADFIIQNNTDLENLGKEVERMLLELNKINKHEI